MADFINRLGEIEKYDTVPATVIRHTTKGILLSFGNELIAFCHANLPVGSLVLATVRKIDYDRGFTLMSIDSVINIAA